MFARRVLSKVIDVEELVAIAWAAVGKAGVPEPLQGVALNEAMDFLRSEQQRPREEAVAAAGSRSDRGTGATRRTPPPADEGDTDDARFFAQLAHESGESEDDLRDVLNLTADGKVQVIPATRNLGSSTAEQAKAIIALVAGGRGKGLNERPVDGAAVREEVDRKGAYQRNNYASGHLGPLRGFNAGSNRNELLLTSRWVGEFKAAIAKAHGRTPSSDEG